MTDDLVDGLYETLRTEQLDRRLAALSLGARFGLVDDEYVDEFLLQHVGSVLRDHLDQHTSPKGKLALVTRVMSVLEPSFRTLRDDAVEQLEQLTSRELDEGSRARPEVPLSETALFTNAAGGPRLHLELGRELESADRVDLLCAFIKKSGLKHLEEALIDARDRGLPFRVLTTTYMGATDAAALRRLVEDFGAEVRISYDTAITRLHAKAWHFFRASGFSTAFVGSSNLSMPALDSGMEWNVRLSRRANPGVLSQVAAVFEGYWNSGQFQDFQPDRDSERLERALAAAAGRNRSDGAVQRFISSLDLTPHPYQAEILDALRTARAELGQHRNIVVAATGTGKTMVAAFDYRDLAAGPQRPTLLYVAHRVEILEQARAAYRGVLKDTSFGELYVGGERPTRWRQVFASVQSLSRGLDQIPSDHFDVVVVDEAHHSGARSWAAVVDHFRPLEYLALTATPERRDGVDIVERDFGGRISAEIRLWDALDRGLLTPFDYFALDDATDLRAIRWVNGRYDDEQLSGLYVGNESRLRIVLNELDRKVEDVASMRALGFCVSVEHAHYMAKRFTDLGLPARAITGETAAGDRAAWVAELRAGRLRCIFTVDVFNEGIDIPSVDTVLLLRPTQSSTVFLQQLGRGLRKYEGKSVTTVLDFVGLNREEFDFEPKIAALVRSGSRSVFVQVEDNSYEVPVGSTITLQRQVRSRILDQLKARIRGSRRRLIEAVRQTGTEELEVLLRQTGMLLSDIYRGARPADTWIGALNAARLSHDQLTSPLLNRARALTHVNDRERLELIASVCRPDAPAYRDLTPRKRALARMLIHVLHRPLKAVDDHDYERALEAVRVDTEFGFEIAQLTGALRVRLREQPVPVDGRLAAVPALVNGLYRRDEALSAFGYTEGGRATSSHQVGVAWCEATQTDLLFVNLRKSTKHFAPSIQYRDYAISRDLFHWESQNSTPADGKVGRRYRRHDELGTEVVLFVREARDDAFGGGAPFRCLGALDYVSHVGEKPMAITWRLRSPMSESVWKIASAVG
ncbi:DUF3427 domain-containing protein [Cumulibacter manganitolerans]|uniref:DUF3427 domain-containing protein n=1 Tax=Cumulibacter manganitolerans TaxID=1884992 RepID=UPI001296E7CD|nr:DUF3427 domain-containing protein [Cumulibacter manganitolerans]